MNTNKDYYRILGVLEDAEDIVIKAAYRALAQKYHPDKFQGAAKVAEERMKEINEAYAVLSDVVSRKKYDAQRGKAEYEDDTNVDSEDMLHSLDKDWSDVIQFYPDLDEIADALRKYSSQLEYTFKVVLLETKNFKDRNNLSKSLQLNFIQKYFGKNKTINKFAQILFQKNRRDVLKKLNRAVNLLGDGIEPEVVIAKFKQEFGEGITSDLDSKIKDYAKDLSRENTYPNASYIFRAVEFLKLLGMTVEQKGIFFTEFQVIDDKGKTYIFDPEDFLEFARRKAIFIHSSDFF
jgi:curved DNA-binding protein CbpA